MPTRYDSEPVAADRQALSSPMEVRIHRTPAQIQEIGEFWSRTGQHPNSDQEHFMLVCQLRREVVSPLLMSVWQEGQCRCLVAGRLERSRIAPPIAYASLPGLRATTWTIVYAGVIGTLDADAAAALATEVDALLRCGDADLVVVNLLAEAHPLHQALRAKWPNLDRPLPWSTHRALALQRDPAFLAKGMRSKHRYWIKRKEKDLETAFPGAISWQWYEREFDLLSLVEKLEAVARNTYQRGLGAGFVDSHEMRERLALLLRRGQLRILLMEVGGRPGAFWLGEVYCGVFHSAATGYSPELRDFEVGTLMLLRMVAELVREGVEQLDFGLGDAHYKERFADIAWREVTLRIFAPSTTGVLLRSYFHTVGRLESLARHALERTGLIDKVKQRWRRLKQARARSGRPPVDDDPY